MCTEASNGREAIELAQKTRPDVAVLDLAMPELNGLEATCHIKNALPRTEVLIFTMHEIEEQVRDVLSAGARGYLLKSDAARDIVAAVEALAEHKPYFTWKVSKAMLDAYLAHRHPGRGRGAGLQSVDPARARNHSAFGRGAQQQGGFRSPGHQCENRGNAPGGGDEEARTKVDPGVGAIRRSEQPDPAMTPAARPPAATAPVVLSLETALTHLVRV